MSQMPEGYYNNFDHRKNYDRALYRDGYVLQGAELNEVQSAAHYRLKGIADALFKDGDVIRDASVIVDAASGAVQAGSGVVYIAGAMRGVPPATFTIPTVGTVAIGVRLVEKVISELEDPSLYNPAVGSRGEGESGAWRLQVNPSWGFDSGIAADNREGEFYPVYTVDNGELRAKEAPPNLDAFVQSLARYDRDSTAGGSYIVSGLTLLPAADDHRGQVYTISEGRARVNGYGVDLPTSRRLSYAAVPDLRPIDTEVHPADASSMSEHGQRITLAHPPLHSVQSLRITTRKVVDMVHGAYSGCPDTLPDTAVVQIVSVRQGGTEYAAGIDYKKNGDAVDWSPLGNEPATGSSYSVTYDCMVAATPDNADADGFSVVGAVENTSILVSYRQALPRIDRLCLTQEGQFIWVQGVASESRPRLPAVPASLLAIGTVYQTWRSGDSTREVVTDGVRVVPFNEIAALNRRIDYVLGEVARQRLESDVFTRESGARVGLFVDPLLDDSMRDQGIKQTAAVVDGELVLPISGTSIPVSADIAVPTALTSTPVVILSQPRRTGSMQVNPYMAFEPLPARVTLTPSVDHWTETQTNWTSAVTRVLTQGWGAATRTSTSTNTETVSTTTQQIEHLRQISVDFTLEGFGPGERLSRILFDGVDITSTAQQGVL